MADYKQSFKYDNNIYVARKYCRSHYWNKAKEDMLSDDILKKKDCIENLKKASGYSSKEDKIITNRLKQREIELVSLKHDSFKNENGEFNKNIKIMDIRNVITHIHGLLFNDEVLEGIEKHYKKPASKCSLGEKLEFLREDHNNLIFQDHLDDMLYDCYILKGILFTKDNKPNQAREDFIWASKVHTDLAEPYYYKMKTFNINPISSIIHFSNKFKKTHEIKPLDDTKKFFSKVIAYFSNLNQAMKISTKNLKKSIKLVDKLKTLYDPSKWHNKWIAGLGWAGFITGIVLCPAFDVAVGVTVIVGAGVVGLLQVASSNEKSDSKIQRHKDRYKLPQIKSQFEEVKTSYEYTKNLANSLPKTQYLDKNIIELDSQIMALSESVTKFHDDIIREKSKPDLKLKSDTIIKNLDEYFDKITNFSDNIRGKCSILLSEEQEKISNLRKRFENFKNNYVNSQKIELVAYAKDVIQQYEVKLKNLENRMDIIICDKDKEFALVLDIKDDRDKMCSAFETMNADIVRDFSAVKDRFFNRQSVDHGVLLNSLHLNVSKLKNNNLSFLQNLKNMFTTNNKDSTKDVDRNSRKSDDKDSI